jgi:hypothetical protein
MYNDNSLFSSKESNSSGSATADEIDQSAVSSPSSSVVLKLEQAAAGTSAQFPQCVSIGKLDEEIKLKFYYLKQYAFLQLDFKSPPVHLLMLESLYTLKMSTLTREADDEIERFDLKIAQRRHDEASRGKQINKLLATISSTTQKLKSNWRRRSKSVENSDKQQQAVASRQLLASGASSQSSQSKHKNYYLLERENLERKYENRIKEIQFEVLNSILDIEIQLEAAKRQRDQELELDSGGGCDCCRDAVAGGGHRRSSQVPLMQKRIRNRSAASQAGRGGDHQHRRSLSSSLQCVEMSMAQIDLIQKYYRNPNVNETMV